MPSPEGGRYMGMAIGGWTAWALYYNNILLATVPDPGYPWMGYAKDVRKPFLYRPFGVVFGIVLGGYIGYKQQQRAAEYWHPKWQKELDEFYAKRDKEMK
eukprot:g33199.t1